MVKGELVRGATDNIASRLQGLENAGEAIHYARRNPNFVLITFNNYSSIMRMIPSLSKCELSLLPYTQQFLGKIGCGQEIPTPEQMIANPKWNIHCPSALDDLRTMMRRADNDNGHLLYSDKSQVIYFGETTRSPEAYIIGVAGHAIERLLSRAIPSQTTEWAKDDFLHACCELVMLSERCLGPNLLFTIFTKPIRERGLGWISAEEVSHFAQEFLKIKRN